MFLMKQFLPRVKRYFKENPGAPFIIGFQVLLIICASLLFQGDLTLANEVAVYAYYLLVVGVVLHFVSFLRHSKEGEYN